MGRSTKIKIIPALTQLIMRDKIIEFSRTRIRVLAAVAILCASITCLPILCIQSSLGQLQQPDNDKSGNSRQTINLQNMTSQQQPLSVNETEFATYASPELGIQIDHPTNWSPIIREFADDVQVLEFNASRSAMMQLLPPTIRISAAPQPNIQSLNQLTQSLLAIASDYPRFDLKENDTATLGNVTAQKVLYTYGSGDPSQQFTLQAMDIWTLKDGKRYVFSYIAPTSEFSMNLPVAEHMIRSLSFE
jgi:photosystem II reaction center protein PsbP